MNDITLITTAIDPSKMYLITPRERVSPAMASNIMELLKRAGIHCVFVNVVMDIIPAEQIEGVMIE